MKDFDEIYRLYYNRVFYYVLDLCRNRDIAEEITQDTFFKVLSKLDTFKGESSITTWIIQIARNNYFNYCKKMKVEQTHLSEPASGVESVEERLLNKESAGELHRLLHKLQEPYKEVFWMRTFGELSFREIGNIHGKTESWARVTYYRAKKMIQEAAE